MGRHAGKRHNVLATAEASAASAIGLRPIVYDGMPSLQGELSAIVSGGRGHLKRGNSSVRMAAVPDRGFELSLGVERRRERKLRSETPSSL